MGFFGKLFEKKVCDICGGEIGLLGNRKLEDGNMCKDCARKLSPWFFDRKESTVDQINAQLRYREDNFAKLQSFRADRILGDYYKMYIEEQNGVPSRFYVTEARDIMSANPDIIAFSNVATCITDIVENRRELKQTVDGQSVSYDPPKFETTYQFYMDMTIRNNPYFDSIRFQVHSYPIRVTTQESALAARGIGRAFLGSAGTSDPTYDRHYREAKNLCQQIEQLVAEGKRASEGAAFMHSSGELPPALADVINQIRNAPDIDTAYRLSTMATQMAAATPYAAIVQKQTAEALFQAQMTASRQDTAPAAPTAPAPAGPRFCGSCGAPAEGGKFCSFCGAKLQ